MMAVDVSPVPSRLTQMAMPDASAASSATHLPHATTVTVGSDSPFLLGPGKVWLVDRGRVDVFAVRVGHGAPVGPRIHVLRAGVGEPLFGIGAEMHSFGLLVVGASGTRLQMTDAANVQFQLDQPASAPAALALVERWVELLYAGITRDLLPPRCSELEGDTDHTLAANTDARPRAPVVWFRHIDGHSHLLNEETLTVNGVGFVPIARPAWLRTVGAVRVSLASGAALAATPGGSGEIWAGLDRMHDLVLQSVALAAGRDGVAQRDRLRRRLSASRAALTSACTRLVAPLLPAAEHARAKAQAAASTPAETVDPLFVACQLVGGRLRVSVRDVPKGDHAQRPRDPLEAIARASRLRTRRVILREDWWRHEAGPLVGYTNDTPNRPVALLPARRGGYTLHDPGTGLETPVTAAVAHDLSPVAQTFYRPFPDEPLSALDVLRFGFRGSAGDAAAMLVVALIASLLSMVPAVATGMLFNSIIPGSQRSQLVQITLVLAAAAVASSLFTLVRGIALLRIEARMSNAVQAAVWDRLLSLPIPFFRPYASGELAVRAMGIDNIRQVISGTTLAAIFGGLFSVSNVGLMFAYSPSLAWRALLLIVGALVISTLGSRLQMASQRTASSITSHTSGVVLQLLSSVGKLRVAGAEGHAFAAWSTWFGRQREAQYRVRVIGNWVSAFNAAFPLAALVIIFSSAQSMLGKPGGMRTGDFLAFLTAFTTSSGALLGTCSAVLGAMNALPLYEQSRPILTARPEVDTAKADPGVLSGDIEVQHANFRYAADGPAVLRDVTLRIEPGQFVAFVGPSGSGKSTLLRLLLGFETLESGAIYYDGQEIGGLDIQAVRRQTGVVLQNGRLRSGDIFTNIVGASTATLDEAWEAARMAGFADDVTAMPMGMHTVVSEGGATLSGGQRQRLLIARALVARPRIFYFDEATSALDNRTQAIVSQSLSRLQATRVVIAHRLSTIIDADRIFVIEHGRVVQSGSYEDLMAHPGVFRELASRQIT